MTLTDSQLLDREIERGKRWGHLTFGQVMDTLDRQYEALTSRWCPKCCATSANDTRCGVCDSLLIVDMAKVRRALQPLT